MRRIIALFSVIIMAAGCSTLPDEEFEATPKLQKVSFQNLPGWKNDRLESVFQAFLISCEKMATLPPSKLFRPAGTYGDFQKPCQAAQGLHDTSPARLHHFFETWFYPYQVMEQETGKKDGLFTGYYEASLRGSLTRYGPYQTPLYAMPDDLVVVDSYKVDRNFSEEKMTAQSVNGKLRRFPARAEIDQYGLSNAKVIVWVDDPVDAFFLHIQGSGVVTLDNGREMRVGYAGKNGHEYYAIGRALIDRGELTKENVSLQTIRAWMKQHPGQTQDLMNLNPSYVFFRALETSGPVGAQGVVLTPQRSLAVDRRRYDYGMPVWLLVEHPHDPSLKIGQLMVAQDTGGAIRGVVRGDFFWGYGEQAERNAGVMKSRGMFWFLLPKTISP